MIYMTSIDEENIERVANRLSESTNDIERTLAAMQQAQPILLAYFFSDSFKAFQQMEREYVLYLVLVIWQATVEVTGDQPMVEEEKIADHEDQNWATLQAQKGGDFRTRITPFFDNYPQEDLLAFAEDALVESDEPEEETVSPEGREALFISLKTLIDCLTT